MTTTLPCQATPSRPAPTGRRGCHADDSPVRPDRTSARCVAWLVAIVGVQGWNIADYPSLAQRRRGHLPRPGLGRPARHRAGALHVLVRPSAARLDPDRRAVVAAAGVRPTRRPSRRDGFVMLVFTGASVATRCTSSPGACGLTRWAAALRACCSSGCRPLAIDAAAPDLPGQHRGDVDPRRVRVGALAAPSPVESRRRGRGAAARGAIQGDHARRRARRLFALWQNSHPPTRSFSIVGFFWCGFACCGATLPAVRTPQG